MPTVGFGRLNADATHEELVERVAKLEKTLEYLFGGLDTKNIREIAGWQVKPTELVSKDGDVGMSTEDTPADDVRLFAGGVDKETAPFKVRESGKMEATGAMIQSTSGYPKIILDPDGQLLAAYSDADNYVALDPHQNGAPAIVFYADGSVAGLLFEAGNSIFFQAVSSKTIEIYGGNVAIGSTSGSVTIDPAGPLNINADSIRVDGISGYTGTITYVKSVVDGGEFGTIVNYGSITVRKGIITSVS